MNQHLWEMQKMGESGVISKMFDFEIDDEEDSNNNILKVVEEKPAFMKDIAPSSLNQDLNFMKVHNELELRAKKGSDTIKNFRET